jgi:hypothetical protein
MSTMYPGLVLSYYSPSSFTPPLKTSSTGFNDSYSYMYRKYINHVHPPLPSSLTLPHSPGLLLSWPVLHYITVHCSVFTVQCSLFSLPWYFTYKYIVFNKSNPLYYCSLPYSILFNSFQCFSLSCYTNVIYLNIIHSVSFSSSFLPPLVAFNSPLTGSMFCMYMYIW